MLDEAAILDDGSATLAEDDEEDDNLDEFVDTPVTFAALEGFLLGDMADEADEVASVDNVDGLE